MFPTATTSKIRLRDAPTSAHISPIRWLSLSTSLSRRTRPPAGCSVRVGDPADEVLAVGDLRVHRPGAGDRAAAIEVQEIDREFGRADVDRESQAREPRRPRRCGCSPPSSCTLWAEVRDRAECPRGRLRGPSAWQAMRRPSAISPAGKVAKFFRRGRESVPSTRRTRQPPQVPAPPADRLELDADRLRRGEDRRALWHLGAAPDGLKIHDDEAGGTGAAARGVFHRAFDDGRNRGRCRRRRSRRGRRPRARGRRPSRGTFAEHPTPVGQTDAGEERVEQPEDLLLARPERPALHPRADGARRAQPLPTGELTGEMSRRERQRLDGVRPEPVEGEGVRKVEVERSRNAGFQALADRRGDDHDRVRAGKHSGDEWPRQRPAALEDEASGLPKADPEKPVGQARLEQFRAFLQRPFRDGDQARVARAHPRRVRALRPEDAVGVQAVEPPRQSW